MTTAAGTTPAAGAAVLPAARQPASSPGQRPPRSPGAAWPATSQGRDAAWERLAGPPFAPAAAKARGEHRLGARLLLDWLGGQPGDTWQDRWLASGADAAGNSWREVTTAWLQDHGHRTAHRQEVMTRTVVTAIRADLIRPTPAWLAEVNFRKGALVNALARFRDPEGFRRLRAACSADAAVSALAAGRVVYRTALIVAAKGGTVSDVTTGDVLEVLDAADDKLTQITASLRRTADAVQLGMPAFPDIAGRSSSDKPVVKDAP